MTHSYISTLFCLVFFGIALRMEISYKRNLDLGDLYSVSSWFRAVQAVCLQYCFSNLISIFVSQANSEQQVYKKKKGSYMSQPLPQLTSFYSEVLILMLEVQGASNWLSCLFLFMPMVIFTIIKKSYCVRKHLGLTQLSLDPKELEKDFIWQMQSPSSVFKLSCHNDKN